MDRPATPHGLDIVCYDLEIKRSIGDEIIPVGEPPRKMGWDDKAYMGISVGILFDYLTGHTMVGMDDNIDSFAERITKATLVVGFNNDEFDNPLLSLTTGFEFTQGLAPFSYDILRESRLKVVTSKFQYPKGLKLDDHLSSTLGPKFCKLGHGAMAPILWQSGQLGALLTYGLGDLRGTCALFEHIWKLGWVSTEQHGTRHLPDPWERYVQSQKYERENYERDQNFD